MSLSPHQRPFSQFRLGIDDPRYFIGRKLLLDQVKQDPFKVRVILGGRRSGKTSTLLALREKLRSGRKRYQPQSDRARNKALPILINWAESSPGNLDEFFYSIVRVIYEVPTLKPSVVQRWRDRLSDVRLALPFIQPNIKTSTQDEPVTLRFKSLIKNTIQAVNSTGYQGICLLMDEADTVVNKDWADRAWSFFRGVKDTDPVLRNKLGLILSGYRSLNDYRQKVGSPLRNIADITWLTPLTEAETKELIHMRSDEEQLTLTSTEIADLIKWTGCHPYLTQQLISQVADDRQKDNEQTIAASAKNLQRRERDNFREWWLSLKQEEQLIYQSLSEKIFYEDLAQLVPYNLDTVEDALAVLEGTGLIRQSDQGTYQQGALLFSNWVQTQVLDRRNNTENEAEL